MLTLTFLIMISSLLVLPFGGLVVDGYCFTSPVCSFGVGRHRPCSPKLYLSSSDEDYYNSEPSDGGGATASSPMRRRPLPNRARPKRHSTANNKIAVRQEEAKVRHQQALQDPTLLSNVKFSDRSDISPATKRAITELMGLKSMTEIQAKTYAAALAGDCVLGRARTGTGKTLAFLLPTIERLLAADLDLYKPGGTIGAIVVAPTRELAIQIADQAETLLTYYKDMTVACIYGGTKIQRDIRLLSGPRMPSILVATPGRLLEHLENTRIRQRKFQDIASETRIVVLDETDRLFEGFYKDTTKILSFLPRAKKRQTLLFSATFPRRLQLFLKESMKIDFTQIDCVGRGNKKVETNTRVDQTYYKLDSMKDYITMLVSIITNTMANDKHYKILVFFPASKLVRFFVKFFNEGLNIPVLEIHSRMSQSSRNKASSAFRSAQNAVLFSSDVSARGVDYPDVSLVVQYGAPSSADAYIHRLGRTGRAGRQGKGLLVLLPFESDRLKRIARLGIQPDPEVNNFVSKSHREQVGALLEPTLLRIRSGHVVLTPSAEAAYTAFLAYYIANSNGLQPRDVVDYANVFALSSGLMQAPTIDQKTASRLGIEGLVEEKQ